MRRFDGHIFRTAVVLLGLAVGAALSLSVLRVTGLDAQRRGAPVAIVQKQAAPANYPSDTPPWNPRDAATPTPSPTATPTPPHSLFDTEQIVSYYGHPAASGLGVLGEGTTTAMLARLRAQVAAYQAINTDKTVVPALHLIYEVAQANTNDDGLYLYRTDDAIVQQYIELARQNNMLLFLDLQIGRSNLQRELDYVMPYLQLPFVHLAIDPEFAMPPGERPGEDIGSLDALDINAALDKIEAMMEQQNIPENKIVVVHQFQETMLTNKEQLDWWEPRVDLVLDMDGFGDQTGKLGRYDTLVREAGARHGGIKLFYTHDVNLLTEQQIEDLVPRPDIIIYQ
jgi:hypothetical protein